jgi:large subunit ribosomal protein L6e
LPSGLLLVTGPFKINGVPLKRVNKTNVIVTKTKVDLTAVKTDSVNDKQFEKPDKKKAKRTEQNFFAAGAEKTEEEQLKHKKEMESLAKLQGEVDKPLLANIKKVEMLKKYLSARFSISNGVKVHDLIF